MSQIIIFALLVLGQKSKFLKLPAGSPPAIVIGGTFGGVSVPCFGSKVSINEDRLSRCKTK